MTELADNPLREVAEGGVGYCYDFDRTLFPGAGELVDGPLLVALDSNVIFDLESHGAALINDQEIVGIGPKHLRRLEAIGALVEAWFTRDIRFVLLPNTWMDFQKIPSPDRMRGRSQVFEAIEEALSFQVQDWGRESERFAWERPPDSAAAATIERVTDPLDRSMLSGAWLAGVDVFVTSDETLRKRVADVPSGFPNVWSPVQLESHLPVGGPTFLSGGTIDHTGCLWSGDFIIGDLGKIGRLLEVLN